MFRKPIVLLLLLSSFCEAYSQKSFYEKYSPVINSEKEVSDITVATDTLGMTEFLAGTPHQYYVQQGGYVGGSNFYNDRAKVQQYNISASLIIEEVILWFAVKNFTSGNPNSAVQVKLYNLDSLGINTTGEKIAPAPGSVRDSVTLLISDIDTSGYTVVDFSTLPIGYPPYFAVGIDLTTLSVGDSVSLMTNTDGNAGGTERSWEQWQNGSWHTMAQAWPLDIDFAIWPVIDTTSSGINDDSFFNGIKMSQNQPNPASTETIIHYELQNNANVTLEVYDVLGKKVISLNEGNRNKGKHSINLTTERLSSGTYYYSLKADSNRITKKLVVAK